MSSPGELITSQSYPSNQDKIEGAPHSAGTIDTRVDRIEEGLPGLATLDNPASSLTPTRNVFDSGLATGIVQFPGQTFSYSGSPGEPGIPTATTSIQVLDTTRTNGLNDSASIRASAPNAGL